MTCRRRARRDRKSTRLNSSHLVISYAVFCLKKKKSLRRLDHSAQALHLAGLLCASPAPLSAAAGEPLRRPFSVTPPPSMASVFFFFLIMGRPPSSPLFPPPPLSR